MTESRKICLPNLNTLSIKLNESGTCDGSLSRHLFNFEETRAFFSARQRTI